MKGAVYIGCPALVLGRVVAASAQGNLPSLLERLPERPMASAFFEELKNVATEVKRSHLEAVGTSWAALAAKEDLQGRDIGTLLVKVGAEGRGGWGGGGVEQRGQWEDPLATQHDRKNDLIWVRPTEVSDECTRELCPLYNQSSHAPSARTVGRSSCRIHKTYETRQ